MSSFFQCLYVQHALVGHKTGDMPGVSQEACGGTQFIQGWVLHHVYTYVSYMILYCNLIFEMEIVLISFPSSADKAKLIRDNIYRMYYETEQWGAQQT